ncbi:MAG: DEAD/DEAH box helicase [Dehalococcoidia bacterium]|jgi:SWI/SNF-related matrix-associated actin-dependent regulator 1 of chromatin subfamily A
MASSNAFKMPFGYEVKATDFRGVTMINKVAGLYDNGVVVNANGRLIVLDRHAMFDILSYLHPSLDPATAADMRELRDADTRQHAEGFAGGIRGKLEVPKGWEYPAEEALVEDPPQNYKNVKTQLRPYQSLAVDKCRRNGGRLLNCDQPGLGKTLQTLAYVADQVAGKTVVVCPAVIKHVWMAEVAKHTTLKATVLSGTKGTIDDDTWDSHDIFIVNYDIVYAFEEEFKRRGFECFVGDEFHRVKSTGHPPSMAALQKDRDKLNMLLSRDKAMRSIGRTPTAAMTAAIRKARERVMNPPKLVGGSRMGNACKGLIDVSKKVIGLTGTPIPNRMEDFYPLVSAVAPKVFPSRWGFLNRYTNAVKNRFGTEFKGVRNQDELAKLIEPFYVRRMKNEVCKELPPITFVTVDVDLPDDTGKAYREAEREYLSDDGGGQLAQLTAMRMACSAAKAELAIDLIDDMIGSEKVIVFSCFREAMGQMSEYYGDRCVTVNGEVPNEERKELMRRFNEDPECRVFVGGMRSAGEGLTLNAASAVVFCDYDWLPDVHKQAYSRAHRIGQDKPVTVYQLTAKGTWIDMFHRKIHDVKEGINDAVFGMSEKEIIKMALEEAKNHQQHGRRGEGKKKRVTKKVEGQQP